MSAYPETGGTQILIKKQTRNRPDLYFQVEEIILIEPDVDLLAEHLRQQMTSSVSVTLTIYKRWAAKDPYQRLEARLIQTVDRENDWQVEQSEIASGILSAFGKNLAGSPPWVFDPLSDLYLLNFNEDYATDDRTLTLQRDMTFDIVLRLDSLDVQVVQKHSPPNDRADGDALVRTPIGDITVFRERGYLRQGWLSINLGFLPVSRPAPSQF